MSKSFLVEAPTAYAVTKIVANPAKDTSPRLDQNIHSAQQSTASWITTKSTVATFSIMFLLLSKKKLFTQSKGSFTLDSSG